MQFKQYNSFIMKRMNYKSEYQSATFINKMKGKSYFNVIFIVIVFFFIATTNSQDILVSSTKTSINALSNYTFIIPSLSQTVDQGATLAITFPSQYSPITLRSNAPYSGYAASLGDACWPTFATCPNNINFSGNTFYINDIFSQAYNGIGFFVQYTIFNIINPDSLSVGTFYMTIFKGNTIYFPPSTGSSSSLPTFSPSSIAYSTSII